jgi:hypothetical protein
MEFIHLSTERQVHLKDTQQQKMSTDDACNQSPIKNEKRAGITLLDEREQKQVKLESPASPPKSIHGIGLGTTLPFSQPQIDIHKATNSTPHRSNCSKNTGEKGDQTATCDIVRNFLLFAQVDENIYVYAIISHDFNEILLVPLIFNQRG